MKGEGLTFNSQNQRKLNQFPNLPLFTCSQPLDHLRVSLFLCHVFIYLPYFLFHKDVAALANVNTKNSVIENPRQLPG